MAGSAKVYKLTPCGGRTALTRKEIGWMKEMVTKVQEHGKEITGKEGRNRRGKKKEREKTIIGKDKIGYNTENRVRM